MVMSSSDVALIFFYDIDAFVAGADYMNVLQGRNVFGDVGSLSLADGARSSLHLKEL